MDIQTIIHKHNDGVGSISIERVQDCTAIAEHAKRLQIEGGSQSSEMKLAASIPFVIVEKYMNDNKISMHEFLGNKDHIRRLCNDPALAHFRVWNGKL